MSAPAVETPAVETPTVETPTRFAVTEDAPHVWIGCLGCYTAGTLAGVWADAVDADEVTVHTITALLSTDDALEEHLGTWHPAAAPHEELWVFDHEGFGDALDGECSPSHARAVAELLAEVDDPDAFGAWLAHTGESVGGDNHAELVDGFTDAYRGQWPSVEAYIEDFYEGTGELERVPEDLRNRIDWEGVARDWMGDLWTAAAEDWQVHVFSAH